SPNMMTYPDAHPGWYAETLTELLDLAANGTIKPIVSQRIPLAEAARAHELLAYGRHAGKIVLTTEPETTGSEPSSWT
ncbi:MAG: zinc-binding dehydrogenase, partial [Acidimicrobiia bacterium]|nr:zinc-binding dehydrogenase [Acidimicrobiia bacterium]